MNVSKGGCKGIKQKGGGAEREICDALNYIIYTEAKEIGIDVGWNVVQRNSNQSAVGGNDLTNTFGLSIEVKRQEALSINTWWKQTLASAKRNNEIPILLFRQNHKEWRCMMYGILDLPQVTLGTVVDVTHCMNIRVEISWEDFLMWFRNYIKRKLADGERPRT
jgi:hypothetical protein